MNFLVHCTSFLSYFTWVALKPFSSALDEVTHKHQIVYFVITNIEYDVLDDTSAHQFNDLYLGGRMGELGCWVDPLVTRIIQVGLEHSRIPDTGSYFDPGSSGLHTGSHPN